VRLNVDGIPMIIDKQVVIQRNIPLPLKQCFVGILIKEIAINEIAIVQPGA
jgi:hypothetical protein